MAVPQKDTKAFKKKRTFKAGHGVFLNMKATLNFLYAYKIGEIVLLIAILLIKKSCEQSFNLFDIA